MITRRKLLKGMAGAAAASVAAPALLKSERELHRHIYDLPTVQTEGFGLAQAKPEGGTYYPDPLDDPAYAWHLVDGVVRRKP